MTLCQTWRCDKGTVYFQGCGGCQEWYIALFLTFSKHGMFLFLWPTHWCVLCHRSWSVWCVFPSQTWLLLHSWTCGSNWSLMNLLSPTRDGRRWFLRLYSQHASAPTEAQSIPVNMFTALWIDTELWICIYVYAWDAGGLCHWSILLFHETCSFNAWWGSTSQKHPVAFVLCSPLTCWSSALIF